MNRMKQLIIFLFIVSGLSVSARKVADLVSEYGSVYTAYHYSPSEYTAAPKGYTPFYISHIGRHGTRYPVDEEYVRKGLRILQRSDSIGALSAEGKRLLRGYSQLDSASIGMYGMLCQRGVDEHKMIGKRMVANFPEVFGNPQRRKVRAISTTVPRCVASAGNLCSALAGSAPRMDISIVTGKEYTHLLCNEDGMKHVYKRAGRIADTCMKKLFDYDSFYRRIYTSLEKAYQCNPNKRTLVESTFSNGTMAFFLGYDAMINCFTPEEYRLAAVAYNNKMYFCHCNNPEVGPQRKHLSDALLEDYIKKTDEAVSSESPVAADLRFSHDVGIMPFLTLIGLKEYNQSISCYEASSIWNSSKLMSMATNIQMIFYRNAKNDVLVKFLLNEKESSLPEVKAYQGPYYRWKDVRAYWKSRL